MSDSKTLVNEVKRSAREEANVSGRWSADEHGLFLRGLEMYGKDYKKIAALVKSRNVTQVKTHAQKHFQKLAKEEAGPLPMSLDPFYQARANANTPVLEKNKRRKIMEEAYKLSPEGRREKEERRAEHADRNRKAKEQESEFAQQSRKAEDADRKRKEREQESEDARQTRKANNADRSRNARNQESEEDIQERLKQQRDRYNENKDKGLNPGIEPGDVYETIRAKLMIKAKNLLHRTKREDGEKTKDLEEEDLEVEDLEVEDLEEEDLEKENHQFHKAPVCIVCDHFIIGVETICKLRPDQLLKHKHRISVESYEKHYKMKLPTELVKQYEVEGLEGMLLSPRF